MNLVRYEKDTAAKCPKCLSILFVFNRDILSGEKMRSASVYHNKGQAPWNPFEKLICRNCRFNLGSESDIIFEKAKD